MAIAELTRLVIVSLFIVPQCYGQCTSQQSGVSTCSFQESYRQSVKISVKSSYRQKYYVDCGFWGSSSCTKYRVAYKKTYRTQHQTVYRQSYRCCPGWEESDNQCIPVCTAGCINGGRCCGPNICECQNGFTGDQCETPVCSPACLHGGTCIKPNMCACTRGLTGQYCQIASNTCPSDVTIPTTPGKPGAIVSWNDVMVNSKTVVTSNHNSGEFFPIGLTVVTYMFSSDTRQTSCSFNITVEDTEPPNLKCPQETEYFTKTGQTRAPVHIKPSRNTDNSGHTPMLIFFEKRGNKKYLDIINGSELSIGSTVVLVEAFDRSKNKASCEYIVRVTARCSKDTSMSTIGELTWEATTADMTTESLQRCPIATIRRNHGLARRKCSTAGNLGAVWEEEELLDCGEQSSARSSVDECGLSQTTITSFNVDEAADTLKNSTEDSIAEGRLLNIACMQTTLANIVGVNSPSLHVVKSVATVLDLITGAEYIYQAEDLPTLNITNRLIPLLEDLIHQVLLQETHVTFVGDNLAIKATTVDHNLSPGFSFVITTNNSLEKRNYESFRDDTILLASEGLEFNRNNSVTFMSLPEEVFISVNDAKVTFVVHKDDKLFQSKLKDDDYQEVIGPLLSVTIVGTELDNLTQPLVFHTYSAKVYQTSYDDFMLNSTATSSVSCVFWDDNQNAGVGDWSEEGCQLEDVDNGWITCHCYHMSTFAVLILVEPSENRMISLVVRIVSKVGSALSMVCLTLVLYILLSGRVERTRSRRILLQTCFSAIVLYFLILIGSEIPKWLKSDIGCYIVGALMHYFILTTMSCIALDVREIYTGLDLKSDDEGPHLGYFVLSSVMTWGLPLVIVGIPFALGREEYAYGKFCFLGPGHILHFGLLLPFGILVQHNLVTLILTIIRMIISDDARTVFWKQNLYHALLQVLLLEAFWISWLILHIQTKDDVAKSTLALQLVWCISGSSFGCILGFTFCIFNSDVYEIFKAACSKRSSNTAPELPPRRSSNPITVNDESPPQSPSYLIPMGHTQPYADAPLFSKASTSATVTASEFEYSYAQNDGNDGNVYEDYEQMDGENESELGIGQEARSTIGKNSIYDPNQNDDDAMNKNTTMESDQNPVFDDDEEYEIVIPKDIKSEVKPMHYWTEMSDDDHSYTDCDQNNTLTKGTHSGAEDPSVVKDDDEYEPVSPDGPEEKHANISNYWTGLSSDEDHSYTECDSNVCENHTRNASADYEAIDDDDDDDVTDYENMNSPISTNGRSENNLI